MKKKVRAQKRTTRVSETNLFSNEMVMLTDALIKMNAILNDGEQLNARGLYMQETDPRLLVMEDLAPYGFRMANRQLGLNEEHCMLAIRGLARFHASSVALCEKEPRWKKYFNRGIFSVEQPPIMQTFFIQGTHEVAKAAREWPEIGPKIADKIDKLADVLYERTSKACLPRENGFNVLNHGDFWVNNMLFKYDDKGRPFKHIFVDFQLPVYSSPAIDLQYFFNTSLSDETLTRLRDKLLKEYVKTLTDTMLRVGCRTAAPSIAELEQAFLDCEIVGMTSTFAVLPIMLMDKDEARDLEELMTIANEGGGNPCYRSTAYRRAILNRLPKWEQMGLIDI